ncbi:MAG: AbrB/MazE/SpoVT family DNA-binding domain-containing protein [Nitrososphaerota archaeon]|nr:AbrB/MazE/SpoVT family DNA-binding domain-containing protein [Nitrososphaerota archaeon]
MSLKLRRTLSKSGRSLVLRIPKDIERALKLQPGQEVEIWIEDDKIIIRKG